LGAGDGLAPVRVPAARAVPARELRGPLGAGTGDRDQRAAGGISQGAGHALGRDVAAAEQAPSDSRRRLSHEDVTLSRPARTSERSRRLRSADMAAEAATRKAIA